MAFCDWLQYTIKQTYGESDLHGMLLDILPTLPVRVQDLIGFENPDKEFLPYQVRPGVNFYYNMVVWEDVGVKICYNPCNPNMGTNVILSGDVLRAAGCDKDDLEDWFVRILPRYDFHISRVDIAYDTDVDFSYFYEKFCKGEYITRYRDVTRFVNKFNRGTLYFGKRGKGTFFRIYDKFLERIHELRSAEKISAFAVENKQSWTRIEGEFRRSQALEAFKEYLFGNIGDIFLGHLNFVQEMKSNKNRCVTDEVYRMIVQGNFKRRLSRVENSEVNIEWLVRVASYVNSVKEVNPDFYNYLTTVEPSPAGVEKCKRSEFDLARFYSHAAGCDSSSASDLVKYVAAHIGDVPIDDVS